MSFSKDMWIDRFFIQFPWAGWVIAAAFVFAFFFSGSREEQQVVSRMSKASSSCSFDLDKIGTGPLALKGSGVSPQLAVLSNQLVMEGESHRPDSQNAFVLLGVRGSEVKYKLKEGEPLFLTMDLENQKVQISPLPQDITVRARDIDLKKAVFEVDPGALFPEDILRTFTLTKNGASSEGDMPFAQVLKKAKFWGSDLLMEHYGGEEFGVLKGQVKLELFEGEESYFLYVKEGSVLSWEGGRWQVAVGSSFGKALAKVSVVSGLQMQMSCWDEEGFVTQEVKLTKERDAALNGSSLLSNVRRRSNSEVTAVIGKKRMVLKTGDWLLKGKQGWRKITSLKGIDACLIHELRGELFIFDRLEGEMLIGSLFDEMRAVQVPLRIPLMREGGPKR